MYLPFCKCPAYVIVFVSGTLQIYVGVRLPCAIIGKSCEGQRLAEDVKK